MTRVSGRARLLLLVFSCACGGARAIAPTSSVATAEVAPTTGETPDAEPPTEALAPEPEPVEAEPPAPPAPVRRVVRLGASGDLLAHIRVVSSARAHGGFEHVLGALRGAIRGDEIAFINLETPLSEERPTLSGSPPILGAPPEVAGVLADVGVDVASVANNHAWDQYSVGAGRTVDALQGAGVVALGAGPTVDAAFAPRFVTTEGGVRVAFVGITERVNGGPGPLGASTLIARWAEDGPVEAALAAARAEAELVVVSIHWSHDFRMIPHVGQRERARWLVEHGADVILGHGPHVLQEVERLPLPRGKAICVYSLGNLVSNQGYLYRLGHHGPRGADVATWLPESRDGVWLQIEAELEGGRVTLTQIGGVPLFTLNDHWERARRAPEDIRIALLRDVPDAALRAERFRVIAETLGPVVTLTPLPDAGPIPASTE